MTLKYGPDATASPREATNLATVDSVSIRSNLRSLQHVADRAQLFEHVVQVGVVVDETLHLSGELAHPLEQHADGVVAFVDRGKQTLRVDQQLG